MSRTARALAWLLLSLASSACSALELGEYELMPCNGNDTDGDAECAALNAGLPVDQCARYYCSETGEGCVLEERRSREICDGADNDCDNYIDEGAAFPDRALAARKLEGAMHASYAVAEDGTLHAVVTHPSPDGDRVIVHSHFAVVEDAMIGPSTLRRSECLGGAGTPDQTCMIRDLAIAATDEVLLGAGFHRSTCGGGQLRVATGSAASVDLGFGEEDRADRTALGVDIELEQGCTVSAGCPGAFEPAVALLAGLEGASTDALVVFRATRPVEGGECSSPDTLGVAALKGAIEGTGAAARFSSSTEERSVLLSERNADGPPALLAFGEGAPAGFIVAFPSGDEIQLQLVPRRGVLDPESETSHVEARSASHVSLAGARDGQHGLAVAHRADTEDGTVLQLRPLRLTAQEPRSIESLGTMLSLRVTGELRAGPSLSYAPTGFATSALDRPAGGWLVVWIERPAGADASDDRLMAARVAEAALHPLGPSMMLAHGVLAEPFTYSKQEGDEHHRLRSVFLRSEALHVVDVSCDP